MNNKPAKFVEKKSKMRIELIIENDDDFSKVESVLSHIDNKIPVNVKEEYEESRSSKMKRFWEKVEKLKFTVDNIDIPNREERNAR